MTRTGTAVDHEKPLRRGRYIFGDPSYTRAWVSGVYVTGVLVELVVAPLALLITLLLLGLILAVRVRRSVALIVAAVGVVLVLGIGPSDAADLYVRGPSRLLDFLLHLPADLRGHRVGAAWADAVDGWWPGWFTGQLPLAVVLGGLQAWWQAFLIWLHTDEWLVKPPRKGLIGWARQRWAVNRIQRGALVAKTGTILGVDESDGALLVLHDAEREGHMFNVGANGSGKSTTGLKLVRADLQRGRPVFAVDLKGELDARHLFTDWTGQAGRPLALVTLDGGAWWDPFRVGSLEERRDMLVGSHDWTGSPVYYRDVAENYTQTVLAVLDATPDLAYDSTLREVVRFTNLAELGKHAALIPAGHRERQELQARVRQLTADVAADKDALIGFRTKLEILANSALGRWLRVPQDGHVVDEAGIVHVDGHPILDLRTFRAAGGAVLFSLNSQRDASMASRIGRLAIQAMTAMFGQSADEGERRRTLVLVDEFAALGADATQSLLARGRSAGADVMLITQTIEDLEIATDEQAAIGRMLSNVRTILAHRIGDEEAAQRVARTAGTRTWVTERLGVRRNQALVTAQRGGTTGSDLVDIDPEHPVVKARTLQDLTRGHFVLISRSDRHGKRVIQQAATICAPIWDLPATPTLSGGTTRPPTPADPGPDSANPVDASVWWADSGEEATATEPDAASGSVALEAEGDPGAATFAQRAAALRKLGDAGRTDEQ